MYRVGLRYHLLGHWLFWQKGLVDIWCAIGIEKNKTWSVFVDEKQDLKLLLNPYLYCEIVESCLLYLYVVLSLQYLQ